MDKIKKLKNDLKKALVTEVLNKVLNDEQLKDQIEQMHIHFKMGKEYNPWPLGYDQMLSATNLSEIEFNILLESLNYKLFYDRNSGLIVFRPEEKNE